MKKLGKYARELLLKIARQEAEGYRSTAISSGMMRPHRGFRLYNIGSPAENRAAGTLTGLGLIEEAAPSTQEYRQTSEGNGTKYTTYHRLTQKGRDVAALLKET